MGSWATNYPLDSCWSEGGSSVALVHVIWDGSGFMLIWRLNHLSKCRIFTAVTVALIYQGKTTLDSILDICIANLVPIYASVKSSLKNIIWVAKLIWYSSPPYCSVCWLGSCSGVDGVTFELLPLNPVPFFTKFPLLIINDSGTKRTKSNKIINRSLDYIAMTKKTSAIRWCVFVLAPPSLEIGKPCHSRAFCTRQMGSRHAKGKRPMYRGATIANDKNRRSEETNLKPHQWTWKLNGS
jgi:hypothetical protein